MSALIEYTTASEAGTAFKALAYSRFGAVPLYLEWAPGDVFGWSKSINQFYSSARQDAEISL